MSTYPWKTTLVISALLAASGLALAQMPSGGSMGGHGQMPQGMSMEQMHQRMMQGQAGMHGGMGQAQQSGSATPIMPGQDAFGAIQEIVRILESDPDTDWSKVNIEALRQHLIDMEEVTLHAVAAQRDLDNGVEITVTGEGRTLAAIKRMLPEHIRELKAVGWNADSGEMPNGVRLTILATEAQPLAKLKALGLMGIMVQGSHHQEHHLMMARGELAH
jgi:hypothetical protein